MSAEKNSPADAAVLSFTDIDHVRRTLVHGSLDISPLAALESRQNIFTTQDFCAPLYGLRHPDLLPHNAYMSFVRYAAHTGTLDQGRLCSLDAQDITLYREAELPRCAQEQAMPQRVLIATSIAPKRIEDQQRAITTWTVQGFSVISVNYPEEIEQLQQHFPHIRFVPTQRDSKAEIGKRRVYIDNILNALYAHGQDADVLGIVNADVGLYRMAPSTLCQICTSGHILISHRINLPSQKPHVVGYDAFFFPARPVGDTAELRRYLLGEPWWDYALPLFFMRHGCTLLQASPPCCFHSEHSEHWSQESWQRLGIFFAEAFQHTLEKGPLCSIPYTFADVFRHPLTSHSLGFLSALFVYMAKKAATCNLYVESAMPIAGPAPVPPSVSSASHYVTYFDKNYLVKALALLTSLRQHAPQAQIKVVCLDEETFHLLVKLNLQGVEPIPLSLFEKHDTTLAKSKMDRSLVEYYWTLTPTLILGCLDMVPEGHVLTYVDADMFFFSSPQPLFEELGDADILIHRHNFSETSKHLKIYGQYNVGLIAFRNAAEGRRVLTWWRDKCLDWCKDVIENDPDGGTRYGDQKYLERFQELSSRVRVCEHPGAGVAPWNHTRFALSRQGTVPHVDGQPTVFYHFHSFALMTPACALPNAKRYLYTLDVVQFFVVPYFTALREALAVLCVLQPDFNYGFRPDALDDGLCVLVCKELEAEIRQAFPLRVSLTQDYVLGVERQMAEYAALVQGAGAEVGTGTGAGRPKKRSLEQALAAYARVPVKPRLLNLGCGSHMHPDWLNLDIASSHPVVYAVDLRLTWPLPSDFFDVVYHSHVLEHMSEQEGQTFLAQCHTVLKPGGLLRVAIPDLQGIVRCYLRALEEAERGDAGAAQRHRWMLLELIDQMARHVSGGAMAEYFKQIPLPQKEFVFSRIGWEGENLARALQGRPPKMLESRDAAAVGAFCLGGEVHRWMYDAFSLRQALLEAGFSEIREVAATESSYADFAVFALDADAKKQTRKPDSLFMEARKPL